MPLPVNPVSEDFYPTTAATTAAAGELDRIICTAEDGRFHLSETAQETLREACRVLDHLLNQSDFPPDPNEVFEPALGASNCRYVLDGRDTDGTPWYRCTVHDQVEISHDAPCSLGINQ